MSGINDICMMVNFPELYFSEYDYRKNATNTIIEHVLNDKHTAEKINNKKKKQKK